MNTSASKSEPQAAEDTDKDSGLLPQQTPLDPHSSVFDWARSGKNYETWRDQRARDVGGYLHLASRVAHRWVANHAKVKKDAY
jgi:hypothetical protein